MAKSNLLTVVQVRNAKPKEKSYRLRDGDGLFLFMPPSGVASWQYRYKLNGKSQTLTIGKVSRYTLVEARTEAGKARRAAATGGNLTTAKRVARARRAADDASTFEAVSKSWMRKRRAEPWSPKHKAQVQASLDNHLEKLYPLPVSEITAAITQPILESVERRAPLMFEKVRARLHRILDHAVTIGALDRNPLPRPEPERKSARRHFPAVTDLPGVGAILRAARASDPCKGIQRAHLLLVFTAQRVSEVVGAEWSEFDLRAGTWSIPRHRMKRKDKERGPHDVPLPPGVLAVLNEWRKADGDDAQFVCPAPRDARQPITAEGVEKWHRDALHLAGKHSPHSWRSAFSTIAREAGKDGDVIEAQLDHVIGTKVVAAYDRAKRFKLRAEIMRWYEWQLIAARDGAQVVRLRRGTDQSQGEA